MKTSKSVHWIGLGLFLFFLTGCGSPAAPLTAPAPITATSSLTAAPSDTTFPSATPQASNTVSPTPASILLTPVVATVPAYPLALNEFNAGAQMKLIHTYGVEPWNDMAFSPDGKTLAAASDMGITLYDSKSFEQTGFMEVNGVGAIAFSPDGLTIAAATGGKVSLWSMLSGQELSTLDGPLYYIWTLAYGKGGYLAAVGSTCGNCGMIQNGMVLWNTNTGKVIHSEKDMSYEIETLAFTSDGKRLAFAGPTGLSIIETETGKLVDTYYEAVHAPRSFIFSADDSSLFVESSLASGDQIVNLASKQRQIFPLCDSRFLRADSMGACFAKDKVILFDLSNGQKISEFDAPGIKDDEFNLAALSPDGKNFIYQTEGFVHIIDIQTVSEIKTFLFTTFDYVQTGMIFLNGVQKYAAALPNERGQVDLVDVETSALLQTYTLPNTKIRSFAFRPDGKIVATLDNANMLALWDIQSQQIIYQTTLSEYVESPFAFSPNGLSTFFKNPDGDILNFDFLKPAKLNSNGKNAYGTDYSDSFFQNNYHFNKAGNLVLVGIANNSPEFRDAKTDEKITLPFEIVSSKQYMEIEAFAISADGKFLAFGSTTGIYVWNLETMKQISALSGHELEGRDGWIGRISDVFFSPQSNLLVSIGHDGTTRLWNIHSGQELWRLDVCCSATFTADGRYLLTAHDGILRVWGIPNRP